jgi:branched-chain amino acid transport system permease protein
MSFSFLPKKLPGRVLGATLILLALVPLLTSLFDQPFYLDIFNRVMILAIATVSLNLLVGYGGMISFGHAAYLGIGAYSVGIPVYYSIYDGYIHLGITIVASGLFALITGAISLRTKGIYFIMITLAFAQMMYYTLVSLDEYGGDDGLVIEVRSEFFGLLDLENNVVLYYLTYAILLLSLLFIFRLVNARFGFVLQGIKHNEIRMQALGYKTYDYKLTCYVISGVMCGIAGFLLGNFTSFISPEMMDWTHSAELLLIIILGGVGSIMGPIVGSTVFILLEQWLSSITIYWHLLFGLMLIAVVLFGRGGIHGLLLRKTGRSNAGNR